MILITGGAGYIGSHTNKLLSNKGYATIVFDNLIRGHRQFVKWGKFFFGDLTDKEQIRNCFIKFRIQAVMHFGAFAYVGESVLEPVKYYHNNVCGTLNLLEVMREFEIRYFIFSSSCTTYGNPQYLPITEDHPQRPINPYGEGKLLIEEILKEHDKKYGMKHIALRYFNAAGADPDGEIGESHNPETHLVPLTIDAAINCKKHVKIFGTDYPTRDGTCVRDYVHVMDLAEAHVKSLEYVMRSNASDSFNLGNEKGYSVKEIINAITKISKKNITVIETARRPGDPPVLISSCNKVKQILKWQPSYDLDGIIETAWRWHSGTSGSNGQRNQ